MENLSFGILDFGFRRNNLNSLLKVEEVINQAIMAEKLGFSRYWIGEHHFCQKTLAWSNPQAIISLLASSTNTIRIGVAGVMLGLYSPYNVATFFKLINNVFNCRIDLAIAKGTASQSAVKYATGKDEMLNGAAFEDKFKELVHLLRKDEELYDEGQGVVIPPYKGNVPEIWSLTNSAYRSADRVINLKTNLSRAVCQKNSEPGFAKDRLIKLQEDFYNLHGEYPKINLAVSVICHRTMNKARKIAGQLEGVQDSLNIVGCPNFFHDKIAEFKENYGVKEFMLYIYAISEEDHYLALRLISKVLKLNTHRSVTNG